MFEFSKHPKRLNLGCGFDRRDGFLNVDINACHNPDLICDAANLQVLPSSYYEYIVANDVLEHIPRLRTRNVLREWNRILVKNGWLELRVPSAIGLLSLLQLKENETPERHEQLLQCLFGTQAYQGDFHYTAFTEVILRDMLDDAGYSVKSIDIREEWLFEVMARKSRDRAVDDIFFLADEEFIVAAYRQLLRRPPDPGGFDHYAALIKSGIAREAIIQAIKDSGEYRTMYLTDG
jgi:predicted SAM-dependent methyltransferase